MKKIILIDGDKKSEFDSIHGSLSATLEFMYRHQNTDNETFKKHIEEECTPEKLWELMKRLHTIENEWYRGTIIL